MNSTQGAAEKPQTFHFLSQLWESLHLVDTQYLGGFFMHRFFMFFIILVFSTPAFAAITLTGDVNADFTNENCLDDDGGEDVGIPGGVAATGWDINKICFYYDGNDDSLHVGVTTINRVIFGDAEGDGNPGASSNGGIADPANLGAGESFVLSLDLNGDSRNAGNDFDVATVDMLVGVSNGGDINGLGAFNVSNAYDPVNAPYLGFGGTSLANVTLFGNPSTTVRDLEFTIADFKDLNVPGVAEIINSIELQVFTGSTVDAGIGDDYLPNLNRSVTHNIFDFDDDGLEDWDELDNRNTDPTDNDTDDDDILDGTEVNGTNPTDPNDADSDDDGCNDGVEDSNQNGAFEPELGESNPNDADTDDDGLDDCTELTGNNPTDPNNPDTDGDGLPDGTEDADKDGNFEPGDGETDPNDPDTDDGGVNDGDEVTNGFDPNDPSDDQNAAAQVGAGPLGNQFQGGGTKCSLQVDATQTSSTAFLLWAMILLLVSLRFKGRDC